MEENLREILKLYEEKRAKDIVTLRKMVIDFMKEHGVSAGDVLTMLKLLEYDILKALHNTIGENDGKFKYRRFG